MTEISRPGSSRKLSPFFFACILALGSACNTTAKDATAADHAPAPEPVAVPGAGAVAEQQPDEDAPPKFETPRHREHEDKDAGLKVTLTPNEAADGGLIFLRIAVDPAKHAGTKIEDVAIAFEEQRPAVFAMGEHEYGSIVPVPFNTKPRKTKLEVILPHGRTEIGYEVIDGKYKSEVLSVAPKYTSPSKAELKRIAREAKEVGAIYRAVTKERYWSGKFSLPIESKKTSDFGNKRIFNGEMKSFHQGADLRARTPTPIRAPEAGVVMLAKHLFFSGGTVIIDHGYGVYTVYAHMSKFRVKPGQRIAKGQVFGLSGNTGRSAAPHLHWGAVVQGAKVNPFDLIRVLP